MGFLFLITCLLDNADTLLGEMIRWSCVETKSLRKITFFLKVHVTTNLKFYYFSYFTRFMPPWEYCTTFPPFLSFPLLHPRPLSPVRPPPPLKKITPVYTSLSTLRIPCCGVHYQQKSCTDVPCFHPSVFDFDVFFIRVIIVSITRFSILIGSARAYLSRNRRAITWVSNYRYPI